MTTLTLHIISLLSLQSLTCAYTNASPRAVFTPSNILQIRQSGDEYCAGSTCPDGECIPLGYHCCSDGASCAAGTDCVPNGCCPIGETCTGPGGTMTFPGPVAVPTLTDSGFGDVSTPIDTGFGGDTTPTLTGTDTAYDYTTPTFSSLDLNTLTSSDAYDSYLATAYPTATGSGKSELGTAQSLLSTEKSGGAFSSTGAAAGFSSPPGTETTHRTPTTSPVVSVTSAAGGGSPSPESQPASGAERGIISAFLVGGILAGLVMSLHAL